MLGQILLDRAWITEKQLAASIDRQQQIGGRLGTCLIELGMITENLLLRVLSEQLGVPAAEAPDLVEVSPEVIATLPAKIATRARAVPFRATASRVDVAMLDIGDITLEDEISFVIGKTVRFHIATELRIAEALARYYDLELPPRLKGLSQRLSSSTESAPTEPIERPKSAVIEVGTSELEGRKDGDGTAPAAVSRPSVIPRQAAESAQRIHLTEEERKSLAQVRTSRQPVSKPDQEHTGFIGALTAARTSSEIGEALLDELQKRFARVLLFKVSGSQEEVTGWLAAGPDINHGWFRAYSAALQRAAVFRMVHSNRSPFRGRLEELPGHRALSRCWDGSLDQECMVLPILVRDHLVCLVYGDRASHGVSPKDLKLAEWVVAKAAIAFERCILRHKLRVG